MTAQERLDRLAYSIFATLYSEYGCDESAWLEAYRRADRIINKEIQ